MGKINKDKIEKATANAFSKIVDHMIATPKAVINCDHILATRGRAVFTTQLKDEETNIHREEDIYVDFGPRLQPHEIKPFAKALKKKLGETFVSKIFDEETEVCSIKVGNFDSKGR